MSSSIENSASTPFASSSLLHRSMYLPAEQILSSIHALKRVHPFHGITFVACKMADLPSGQRVEIRLDAITKSHMDEHHRLAETSNWYFQPFKSTKAWVRHDYPSGGLQSINTRTFGSAFLHTPNMPLWGWSEIYVKELADRLVAGRKIPAFDLAAWLYRRADLPGSGRASELVDQFLFDYQITPEERVQLFDLTMPVRELRGHSVQAIWPHLKPQLSAPPDAAPEHGASLHRLELRGTGPAKSLTMTPADHLTLITGDNGLGKTFLLECAWWALTGTWPDRPAFPRPDAKRGQPQITFAVSSKGSQPEAVDISYDWENQIWARPRQSRTVSGLAVYARVDGSFAVWDPAKSHQETGTEQIRTAFSSKEIWDGRGGDIEGIVRDWGRWQREPESWSFQTFVTILKTLSPPDLGELIPGELTRVPNDLRDIPTIMHAYGETPILFASAGVKRILALTYLMVWAWQEHRVAARLSKRHPETSMVVLIDELEAHLHPKWQRGVLPAIVAAVGHLASDLSVQMLVTTHSPLVLASAEPIFSPENDQLLHLKGDSRGVFLEETPFVKHGEASRWLTSTVFGMKQARSHEAEKAIEAAKTLQIDTQKADFVSVQSVTARLRTLLANDDPFWPRWIGFADQYGVDV